MQTQKFVLTPSYLVQEIASVRGGLHYHHSDRRQEVDGKQEKTHWATDKTVEDVEERAAAVNLCAKIKRQMRSIAADSVIGLICPRGALEQLQEKADELREEVREHNADARHSRVDFNIVPFEILPENLEAAEAIKQQIQESLASLTEALDRSDPKDIRAVIAGMKGLDGIVSEDQGDVLKEAIQSARAAATTIVKEVEKEGKAIEEVRREINTSPIEVARLAFADFSPYVEK